MSKPLFGLIAIITFIIAALATALTKSPALAKRRGLLRLTLAVFLFVASGGCQKQDRVVVDDVQPLPTAVPPTSTAAATIPPPPPTPTAVPKPTITPTAVAAASDCGQLLPILSAYEGAVVQTIAPDADALAHLYAIAHLRTIAPADALPALDYLLENPEQAGLAAYRAGEEERGVYLNPDAPMPLASVVKLINLVAYAEAVAAGELDPLAPVPLADLEAFYLPNLDLNAHPKALEALEANGEVFGDPPTVLLEKVPQMMVEYSSNAAADYLHALIGQKKLEETAVSLNLSSQTAPCPFLGQFLTMANHTRPQGNDQAAIKAYLDDPAAYGREAAALTAVYSGDPDFRQEAIAWRRETRRPNGQTQRLFTDSLNAQGSAGDYADLMAQIAQNQLGSAESSFTARRYLEWVMKYPANQELFSNLGYKNGSLPGALTTAYYAYPLGETTPVVAVLFFRGLNGRTYQGFRQNLAHDELARWFLYDPEAIPALRAVLAPPDAEASGY